MNGKLTVDGFLKAKGTKIVNEKGEEIFLRGMNLGNWFLPEAYMMRFPKELGTAKIMEKVFAEILGDEKANAFWESFYDRYTTEEDIKQIAKEGYNSIRLPLNYRLFMNDDGSFIEDRMKRIDTALDWCEKAGMYVIIDLHGAPGGQTGTNIDDSDGHPNLFTDDKNVELTAHFWRTVADRYKDRYIVGGYDLLNEPVPRDHEKYQPALIEVYKRLIKAIREVDNKHIIILECANWATEFRIFKEKLDDNMAIEFHKYWCPTDYRFVRDYINLRETLNVPIWMGESGENNLDWYTSSFQMLEDYNISWCFWPWKKMDTFNTPCSVKIPKDWEKLSLHAKGEIKLDAAECESILNEYLDNILLENCVYRTEVINAMMRRVPFRIPAESYGLGGVGESYYFTDKVTTCVNFRREEGANIKFVHPKDDELPKYNDMRESYPQESNCLCLIVQEGDWVKYEINSTDEKVIDINAHISGLSDDAIIELWLNSEVNLTGSKQINKGWDVQTLAEKVVIPAGMHSMKMIVRKGSVSVNWFELK